SKTFCFDLEENSSGNTTTRSDYSFPDYEAFYPNDDHIEEKSSGSTSTHANFSQYDSFIFDLSINPFPPADRCGFYHEEFSDELAHIISPPEYDCFYFKSEPDPSELTSIVDSGIRENVLYMTNVNLPFEDDQYPLLAYVVWIFLAFLTYPVSPPYLLSIGNEDTIFNPGISIYHSFDLIGDCPDFEASRAHGFVLRSLELQELHILAFIWKRISDKRTKNKAKNDKTEHEMEKRGQAKVKSKSTPTKSMVKTRADTEEYLMGPPEPI
ncbi:hypothetical protein Tco_1348791, partial [Tanacetum coccineum]